VTTSYSRRRARAVIRKSIREAKLPGPDALVRLYLAEASAMSRFWALLGRAAKALYEDGCLGIAKGAAYSALLAFFPILTTIAAILVQSDAAAVARTVARLLYDVVPPGTEAVVQDLFTVRGQRPTGLLAVAVILAAWAGSGVMMSLMDGFRTIYRIPSGRSFFKERMMAVGLVFVAAIPVLGASGLIVYGNRTQRTIVYSLGLAPQGSDLRGWVRLIGQALNFAAATGAIVIILALIFYFGPNRKQSLAQVFPGALLATILWLISTTVFGAYVRYIAQYNLLYGGVGAGLALLVWSYMLAVISLWGCEYNAVRERG
jgi:membrane protein